MKALQLILFAAIPRFLQESYFDLYLSGTSCIVANLTKVMKIPKIWLPLKKREKTWAIIS